MLFLACITFINCSSFTWEQKDHREIAELNAESPRGRWKTSVVTRDIASYTRGRSIFESISHPQRPRHIEMDENRLSFRQSNKYRYVT